MGTLFLSEGIWAIESPLRSLSAASKEHARERTPPRNARSRIQSLPRNTVSYRPARCDVGSQHVLTTSQKEYKDMPQVILYPSEHLWTNPHVGFPLVFKRNSATLKDLSLPLFLSTGLGLRARGSSLCTAAPPTVAERLV